MKKFKSFKIYFLLILFFSLFGFYWFQIRPAQIKHDCSWVKVHEEGQAAQPAMAEDELRAKGLLQSCNVPSDPFCGAARKALIESYSQPKEAISPKDWWKQANPKQYEFCLHDKGL